MAEKNAIFGLFANDHASKVFKDLGLVAKKSAGHTKNLEDAVAKASVLSIKASEAQRQAQAKAQIAQAKYTETMQKATLTESQRLAAQERLTAALNLSDSATMKSEAALSALTSAEARATFGATKLGNAHQFANSKMASLFKNVTMGASAFAGYEIFKFGKQSVTAAEDFQVSQTKLETSIKNSGHAWAEYSKPVDNLNTKMAALGFRNTETQNALAVLTTALNDPAKALEYMGKVADLARHQNMPLADSALLVAKAYEGQLRPLRALGIDAGVAASGVLKIKTAHDAFIKARMKLAELENKSHSSGGKTVAQNNAVASSQQRLNGLLYKYNDPMQRTISQTNQINSARLRLAQAEGKGAVSASALKTAQDAVAATQQKYNDSLHSGEVLLDTVTKRMSGSAVAATNDLKVKQDALNASYEEMQRKVGMKLLPDLAKFTDWMNKSGIPDMEKLGHWVSVNKDNLELLGEGLAVFYVGSKLGVGLKEMNLLLKGTALAGGEAALAGKAVDAAWLPVAGTVGAVATAVAIINRLTKGLDPQKTLPKHLANGLDQLSKITGISAAGGSSKASGSSTSKNQLGPQLSIERANTPGNYGFDTPGNYGKQTGKPLTTSKGNTTNVTIHVHGSVTTEKKLIDAVHNGIAQNMKRAGKDPKTIGK